MRRDWPSTTTATCFWAHTNPVTQSKRMSAGTSAAAVCLVLAVVLAGLGRKARAQVASAALGAPAASNGSANVLS